MKPSSEPVILVGGDRLRLTRELVRTVVTALQHGEDHVIVEASELTEEDGVREVRLVLGRGRAVVPPGRGLNPGSGGGLRP